MLLFFNLLGNPNLHAALFIPCTRPRQPLRVVGLQLAVGAGFVLVLVVVLMVAPKLFIKLGPKPILKL